jgi:glutamate-1-semialdehyde 2,1-aminomutase
VQIGGEAPRTVVAVAEPEPGPLFAKSVLQQELVVRGVLFNGSNFICLAHSDEDLDQAIAAYEAGLARMAEAWPGGLESILDGEPLQAAFRPV